MLRVPMSMHTALPSRRLNLLAHLLFTCSYLLAYTYLLAHLLAYLLTYLCLLTCLLTCLPTCACLLTRPPPVRAQLFGGRYSEANGYGAPPLKTLPRYHFDSFVPAMLTCFVLTTGGWYAPMLDGVKVNGAIATVYFTAVVLIGQYILMNLLVAVLLQVRYTRP